MSAIDPSSLNPGKHGAWPVANSGSLEGFIRYMGLLASSSECQFAGTVLDEITQLREKIQSQDEELKALKKKIVHITETKTTTINEMFKANQDEKAKQKDSATQIESLCTAVDEKEGEIAESSKNLGLQRQEIAKLKSACSQEVAKVSQSARDISRLEANLKERDKMIDQMKTAGSKLKSMLSSEQRKNAELKAANASMTTELEAVKVRIQKVEDFAVQFSDVDEDLMTRKFTSLWTSATNELSPLLEQDIPESVLKEKAIWEKLRKVDNIILPQNFPLIPSNSPAAKAIRFALILAVLFREIDQRIFQPSYYLSESNNLREALEHLAISNGEKEAFYRRVFLSIDPDAKYDNLNDEIQNVVQRMLSYAGGLFHGAQYDLFCSKIKKIVQNASEAWLPVQRAQQKFETEFEPFDPEDNEWDRFPSAGENKALGAQDLQGLYVLNVFPCLSLVEDGGHDPLTKIIQLRSSQELYLAAHHEATQIGAPVVTRRSSTRPRRQPTAVSNGKPFLGGSSAKG